MFLIFTPHKTRTFTVRLAVTTNTKETDRFYSTGVAWTRPPKSRPNRSHRKRSYSISNIGNMMGFVHLSCVPVGPFAGELWHFEYFPTTTVRQLLIFDHMTVTVVRICCCVPNFIKNGSCVRPPDAHYCWTSSAPLLSKGRCHGNRIMANMSGTWWNVTTQVSSISVHWYASYSISNIF